MLSSFIKVRFFSGYQGDYTCGFEEDFIFGNKGFCQLEDWVLSGFRRDSKSPFNQTGPAVDATFGKSNYHKLLALHIFLIFYRTIYIISICFMFKFIVVEFSLPSLLCSDRFNMLNIFLYTLLSFFRLWTFYRF